MRRTETAATGARAAAPSGLETTRDAPAARATGRSLADKRGPAREQRKSAATAQRTAERGAESKRSAQGAGGARRRGAQRRDSEQGEARPKGLREAARAEN